MKKILAIIFFASFLGELSAQVQRCGLPNYRPKKGDAHLYIDTCNAVMYKFQSSDYWMRQGSIYQFNAPQDEFASSGGIKISNTEADWVNLNNGQRYKWTGFGWTTAIVMDIDKIVYTYSNQYIEGKKIFADTIVANSGLKSGGLIETKGINTEGSSTKAAATLNGVIAEKDTVIATNYTLNGSYGSVGFDCTNGVKSCTLPNVANTIDWTFIIRKEDDSVNILQIKNSSGTIIYTLYSRISITFKNKNGQWKRLK